MTDKILQVPAILSTSYLSLYNQKTTLTGLYAQSAYNIAWLNESLPPFMDLQGMLAPFGVTDDTNTVELAETWTTNTLFYSVDINCEEPGYDGVEMTSSWGCKYGNSYMNLDPTRLKKDQYSTMYVGYWYEESMDSYLQGQCPQEANQTFLVRWLSGVSETPVDKSQPQNVNTTLWCRPFYYQQEVRATVIPPQMNILDIVPMGPKKPFSSDLINITDFEWSMSQGYEKNNNRGSFPTSSWPDPKERVQSNFPQLVWSYYLPNLASFALGAYQRPVSEYLEPEILKDSYQAAYRLLLARKLADVLSTNLNSTETVLATRHYQTQTVIMVPAFVYIVEGLLATTIIIAFLIFVVPSWRRTNLVSEPASIASLMTLTSNDHHIIENTSQKDSASSQELEKLFQKTTFVLRKGSDRQIPTLCYLGSETQSPVAANVVSVAFSNLLFERTIMLPASQNFTIEYQLPINASGIPQSDSTYDHFYVAMSNLTAGTPLPAWTDESFFYVPFQPTDQHNVSATLYRARTPAVSTSLHCYPMHQRLLGKDLIWNTPVGSPSCDLASLQTYESVESQSPEAAEYFTFMCSYTGHDHIPDCELSVQTGWVRSSVRSTDQPPNASWIGCQPQIRIELREVTVDYSGSVQSSMVINDTMEYENSLLQAESNNIIDAYHTLLTKSNVPEYPYDPSSNPYHNDSYPSDFFNYLMAQTLNSSANLDPHLPPPSFNTTAPFMEALYARIFAIVLGTHIDAVL
ncbi:hypothetical protein KCU77_g3391, partial [Aureobasidium melanogenum]